NRSLIFHELFDTSIDTEVIQQMYLKTIHTLRGFPKQLIVDEKTEYHLIALLDELDILDDLRDRLLHTEIFLEEMIAATSDEDRKSTRLNSSHVSISYAV